MDSHYTVPFTTTSSAMSKEEKHKTSQKMEKSQNLERLVSSLKESAEKVEKYDSENSHRDLPTTRTTPHIKTKDTINTGEAISKTIKNPHGGQPVELDNAVVPKYSTKEEIRKVKQRDASRRYRARTQDKLMTLRQEREILVTKNVKLKLEAELLNQQIMMLREMLKNAMLNQQNESATKVHGDKEPMSHLRKW